MKLGLGLYKSLLTDDNFRFARQAGATDIVAQLVDYVKGGKNPSLTKNYLDGWGTTDQEGKIWTYEQLRDLSKRVESHGLRLAAIENFDPAHWYDVLLDGPKKFAQIEDLKTMIRNAGRAGIPMIGYYFSLAGVWGWTSTQEGRGNPISVSFDAEKIDVDNPIPQGMVWNMWYRPQHQKKENVPPVSHQDMWARIQFFLHEVLPVAEEVGVKLVAHPDDPPVASLRQTARLFYKPKYYERLLNIKESPSNGFEFCMGTIQEMTGKYLCIA